MKKKLIITAANGFLGQALIQYFKDKYQIVGLVRKPMPSTLETKYVLWDGVHLDTWQTEFEQAFAVINLAGRTVDCRYNEKNKAEIYRSRLNSTKVIADAIRKCNDKPTVWLNSASATIYRHEEHQPMTEEHGIYGTGFSVDVCQQWEKMFYDNKIDGVRQIALRTAIVLGKGGGVMVPFLNLARFGLGGKMGKGNQQFSWIHTEDFCKAVEFLIVHKNTEGSYNVSSPNPILNAHFMKTLRDAVGMPIGIPTPKWFLEIGAFLIRTETELILKSRFVVPERLLREGFKFKFDQIEHAVNDIVSKRI